IVQEPSVLSPAGVPDVTKQGNFAWLPRVASTASITAERSAADASADFAPHTVSTKPKAPKSNAALSRPIVPNSTVKAPSEPGPNLFSTGLVGAAPAKMELPSSATVLIAPAKAASSGSQAEKFLEIGRFKEKPLADKTKTQIAQLGFPA